MYLIYLQGEAERSGRAFNDNGTSFTLLDAGLTQSGSAHIELKTATETSHSNTMAVKSKRSMMICR